MTFDGSARMITVETPLTGEAEFRRTFVGRDGLLSARLIATAFGVFEVELNGARVNDEFLNPGWTSYGSRLTAAAWDVTRSVRSGLNSIRASVGDGWYRGRLGWRDRSAIFGGELGLLLQLELEYAEGRELIVTDEHWQAATHPGRTSSIYDGASVDLRLDIQSASWRPAQVLPLDQDLAIEMRRTPAVREIARRPLHPTGRPGIFDAGQNLVGWVRVSVDGRAGDEVIVRHAEVLDPQGALYTAALRGARATDRYVLARDGRAALEPRFTFHGFRFAEITGARVVGAEAIAISSATSQTSAFECSVPALNQLHANTMWSQLGNFVSIPTDCPQRDERLGWTGDAQAYAATSCVLFDSEDFWTSWLTDLAHDQRDDGSVPSVVPNILLGGDIKAGDGAEFGRAGWADAATIVPWAVYRAYGNEEVLLRQLPSMRAWVGHLERRAGTGTLPDEFQFGDWLDPDAPPDRPSAAKCPAGFLAEAFFSHSARLLADAEALVGDPIRARDAAELARRVGRAAWKRWGERAAQSQTGCAIALRFRIAPETARPDVARRLARLVREADGRIATGFLGTPHVLPALSDAGYIDEAYLMLLRRKAPSWLYQVDQGATTIWERWDAIKPDGSIHSGEMADDVDSMLSFNHYAYGAVTEWLYSAVAGIGVAADGPGYRVIDVAPRPHRDVTWAKAHIDTRRGRLSIEWELGNGRLEAQLVVPEGSTARLDLPVSADSEISIDGAPSAATTLGAGVHTILVGNPRIAG